MVARSEATSRSRLVAGGPAAVNATLASAVVKSAGQLGGHPDRAPSTLVPDLAKPRLSWAVPCCPLGEAKEIGAAGRAAPLSALLEATIGRSSCCLPLTDEHPCHTGSERVTDEVGLGVEVKVLAQDRVGDSASEVVRFQTLIAQRLVSFERGARLRPAVLRRRQEADRRRARGPTGGSPAHTVTSRRPLRGR